MLAPAPIARAGLDTVLESGYFHDVLTRVLRYIDTILDKSPESKVEFLRALPQVLDSFDAKIAARKVLPALVNELRNEDISEHVVPVVFQLVRRPGAPAGEFREAVWPSIVPVIAAHNPPGAIDAISRETPLMLRLLGLVDKHGQGIPGGSPEAAGSDWDVVDDPRGGGGGGGGGGSGGNSSGAGGAEGKAAAKAAAKAKVKELKGKAKARAAAAAALQPGSLRGDPEDPRSHLALLVSNCLRSKHPAIIDTTLAHAAKTCSSLELEIVVDEILPRVRTVTLLHPDTRLRVKALLALSALAAAILPQGVVAHEVIPHLAACVERDTSPSIAMAVAGVHAQLAVAVRGVRGGRLMFFLF
jgi:hypothetical protein